MSLATNMFSILAALVVTPILTLVASKAIYEHSKLAFKASVCTALLAGALVSIAIVARIAFDSTNINASALTIAYISVWYLFSATGAIKATPIKVASQAVFGFFAIGSTLFALLFSLAYQNPEPIYMRQYSETVTCRVYVVGVASNNAPMLEAEVHQHSPWIPGLHRQIHVQPFSENSPQPTPSEACATARPWTNVSEI